MAAHSKPGTIATLVKGKVIDAIKGVVDTLNWIVSCWDYFVVDGKSFVTMDGVKDGKPLLKVDADKFKKYMVDFFSDPDNIKIITDNIYIQGGEDTNMEVTKNGGTFTINVYYK